MKQLFASADTNKDGTLSVSELRGLLTKFTVLQPHQADTIIKQFDRNGDGRMQYQEFVDWMTGDGKDRPAVGAGGGPDVLAAISAAPKVQGTWTAIQWLATLGGDQSLFHIIRDTLLRDTLIASGGGDELSNLCGLSKKLTPEGLKEFVTKALAGSVGKMADVLVEGIQSLVITGSGEECNSKFQQDKAHGLKMGGLTTFFRGLEGEVGTPSAKVVNAVYHEHFEEPDSATTFVTGNYGISTTSRTELEYVVALDQPDSVKDEDSCVAWIAKLQKDVDEAQDTFGEAGKVSRDETVNVLEADLSERLAAKPSSTRTWPAESVDKLKDRTRCRHPVSLKQFMGSLKAFNKMLRSMKEEPLSVIEFVGARLYTGPMFVKYNTVLRKLTSVPAMVKAAEELCFGNQYVTTLHVINSALLKMAKIQPAERVYRGMAGCFLPEEFMKPNEFNVCGGVEYGFMSTTTDREVAVHYAGAKAGIVFEIQLGMVDRGASLRWLSQYPYESEICFGPLSGLQVVGSRVENNLLIVEVRLSVNLQSLTIEQVIGKRRKGLKDMCETLKMEVRSDVAKMTRLDNALTQFLEREVAARFHDLVSKDVELYNDDTEYEKMFHCVLKTRQAPHFFLKMIDKFAGEVDGSTNPKEVHDGVSPLLLPTEGEFAADCPAQVLSAFATLRQENEAYAAFAKDADPLCEIIINKSGQALEMASDEFSNMLSSQATSDTIKVAYVATKDEVVRKMVPQNGLVLKYANENLKSDRSIVLAACAQNGLALEHVAESLKADVEVVVAAVLNNGLALEHASESVKAVGEVNLAVERRSRPSKKSKPSSPGRQTRSTMRQSSDSSESLARWARTS